MLNQQLIKLFSSIMVFTVVAWPISSYSSELLANKSSNTQELSKVDIKSIFLGSNTNWDNGQPITLCLLSNKSDDSAALLKHYTGKNLRSFKRHWTKMIFSGNASNMPIFYTDADKAITFLDSRDGAFCIVSPNFNDLPKSVVKISDA